MHLSEKDIARHDALVDEAARLMEGQVPLDHTAHLPNPSLFTKLRLRKARNLFLQVLGINPENGFAHFNLALVCLRFEEPQEAIKHLERARILLPDAKPIARILVITKLEQGPVANAIEDAMAALQQFPDDPGLHVNLGLGLLISSRATEAVAAFSRTVELEPQINVNAKLLAYARRVEAGEIPAPSSERDVARAVATM